MQQFADTCSNPPLPPLRGRKKKKKKARQATVTAFVTLHDIEYPKRKPQIYPVHKTKRLCSAAPRLPTATLHDHSVFLTLRVKKKKNKYMQVLCKHKIAHVPFQISFVTAFLSLSLAALRAALIAVLSA